MKILITGSGGFLGSNLIRHLKPDRNVEILSVVRSTPEDILRAYLEIADCIFHIAGEVRPGATSEDYIRNNSRFTETIAKHLVDHRSSIPILMVSSFYAVNTCTRLGIYGQTKREAELSLEYYRDKGGRIVIYRLPHVFGEGARPNHNSVITTWIHNKIHQLPITVYDRNIHMTYCYVQDVVHEFTDTLLRTEREGYLETPVTYSTYLGEVADFIDDIANGIDHDNPFFRKLKTTYQYYLVHAQTNKEQPGIWKK